MIQSKSLAPKTPLSLQPSQNTSKKSLLRGLLDTVQTLCNDKKDPNIPKSGVVYAVHEGKLKGEFLVFMEERGGKWVFFAFFDLPEFHLREIPKKDFTMGLDMNILTEVEKLPSDVFAYIRGQYQMIRS